MVKRLTNEHTDLWPENIKHRYWAIGNIHTVTRNITSQHFRIMDNKDGLLHKAIQLVLRKGRMWFPLQILRRGCFYTLNRDQSPKKQLYRRANALIITNLQLHEHVETKAVYRIDVVQLEFRAKHYSKNFQLCKKKYLLSGGTKYNLHCTTKHFWKNICILTWEITTLNEPDQINETNPHTDRFSHNNQKNLRGMEAVLRWQTHLNGHQVIADRDINISLFLINMLQA